MTERPEWPGSTVLLTKKLRGSLDAIAYINQEGLADFVLQINYDARYALQTIVLKVPLAVEPLISDILQR